MAPIAASQVIALAREAMRDALRDSDQQAGDASEVSSDLKPGLTVNLSHKNIQRLPNEVVDIMMNKLERFVSRLLLPRSSPSRTNQALLTPSCLPGSLALSHNKLSSFPARFSECTALRYLNVRNNEIREFPLPVNTLYPYTLCAFRIATLVSNALPQLCDLTSLEILDLGRNRLRVLPPEIVKLASLKVFAVQKNRIEELPLCLADMASLQVLKLDGNPIKFPPPEVFQVQAISPPNEGFLKESEVTEVTVTSHIKKFLRQRAQNGTRVDTDTGGDESSEGTETPRLPMKRVMSGRFPIKVNGTDVGELRSPGQSRPPPIPARSHNRGFSQQNTVVRRPGVMPLTMGNVNERVRSNSETTLLQAPRGERPGDRSRRMGIVSKKAQELGTLEEAEAGNRISHYRGLSHGSAMQGNGANITNMANDSPVSPADAPMSRPVYVRRMSILPERRRESKVYDPVVEAAKGILYSVFQIHPMIQMLMGLTNDGTAKRSSLEIVFYNTNSHVEELEREILRHDPSVTGDEDVGNVENENVHRACITLVNAYAHVCSLLASNVDLFIDNGDPRYIRTLLVQLYNSIMELRVTTSQVSPNDGYRRAANRAAIGETIKPSSRESSVTPTAERPGAVQQRIARGNFVHNPSNLRVATDVPMPYINGTGRTATITSATPRSGESFASTSSRGMSADFSEEDRLFERIFLSLQKSSDLVMRTLPNFNAQFTTGLRNAMAQRAPEQVLQCWKILIAKCNTAIQQTEILKSRLSNIKLKEPGIRTQGTFWTLCNNFLDSWAELAHKIRDFAGKIQMPMDTRTRLRPIHTSMKETMELILQSPWAYYMRQSSIAATSSTSPFSAVGGGGGGGNPVQLPMTPQSAALGPAVQATVPSTPQSASFAGAFSGNVFERADALISAGGLSMARTTTFSSSNYSTSGSSSLNSISSTLSGGADGTITPQSMLSPGPGPLGPVGGPLSLRLNNGSKVAF